MKNVITISGERQSGKTTLLGALIQGAFKTPIFFMPSIAMARDVARRLGVTDTAADFRPFREVGSFSWSPATLIIVDDFMLMSPRQREDLFAMWSRHAELFPQARMILVKDET